MKSTTFDKGAAARRKEAASVQEAEAKRMLRNTEAAKKRDEDNARAALNKQHADAEAAEFPYDENGYYTDTPNNRPDLAERQNQPERRQPEGFMDDDRPRPARRAVAKAKSRRAAAEAKSASGGNRFPDSKPRYGQQVLAVGTHVSTPPIFVAEYRWHDQPGGMRRNDPDAVGEFYQWHAGAYSALAPGVKAWCELPTISVADAEDDDAA